MIAAYNEGQAIAPVLAGVRPTGHRIVVVDDGSTDGTADVASNAGAIVIRHPVNLGQGAALQTGITFALSRGAEFIVTFDADGQHSAAHIPDLLAALVVHNADFALGSRFLGEASNIPYARRLLLQAAARFTRLTTRLSLTDTHNGMRAMTRRGAEQIHLRQNRMAHASEILAQIARSGLKYVEVPVTIEYSPYSLGKGQRSTDSISILVDLFVRRLKSMIAQLILTAMLAGIVLYAGHEHRRSPVIAVLFLLAAVAAIYLVWLPSHATGVAHWVGVGRGVDLIIYLWVVISLLVALNLHLKMRVQLELITALAREIAIANASRPHRSGVNSRRSRPGARVDLDGMQLQGDPASTRDKAQPSTGENSRELTSA